MKRFRTVLTTVFMMAAVSLMFYAVGFQDIGACMLSQLLVVAAVLTDPSKEEV